MCKERIRNLQCGQEMVEEGHDSSLQNHECPENDCLLPLPKQEEECSELKPAVGRVRANRRMTLVTSCVFKLWKSLLQDVTDFKYLYELKKQMFRLEPESSIADC